MFVWFFRFATKEPNGLLLYNGRFNEKHDFIAMEIISEQIQLTFSAGRTVIGLYIHNCYNLLQNVYFTFISSLLCSNSHFSSLSRWDQDYSFTIHPRRCERRPVAHGGSPLLQQGMIQIHSEQTPPPPHTSFWHRSVVYLLLIFF